MTDYLNSKFDWTDPQVVSAFDELSLWSAMAGMLLLEHVPLSRGMRALDIGCGTGFPLLELAQRLGPTSTVSGVDTSQTVLDRARQKAQTRGITNVEIVRADAAALPWPDETFDLIICNLGINNFDDRPRVLRECHRVTKSSGTIALTTNLAGHMSGFYDVFRQTLVELNLSSLIPQLETHISHRTALDELKTLLRQAGFSPDLAETRSVSLKYADARAFLTHSFIRAAFLPAWIEIVKDQDVAAFFQKLEENLNRQAADAGELLLSVPFAYVEASRR